MAKQTPKNKKIIVTGGAGFIGSNLVDRLAADNEVYIIDNLNSGSPSNIKDALEKHGAKFIKDDVKNIAKHNIPADMVFHLGIYSSSPMYRENPHLIAEVVDGMISVLEYVKGRQIPLVFASTSSIYNGVKPPHREDVIPAVTDYYTEARYAAERVSELYARLHSVNVAAMRFFSVYGRHEEAKGKYANLVSQFLWSMKKGEQPVIYGDGMQTRDFVFADDVVDALIAGTAVKGFDVFNVGTGKNYTLNELVNRLNKTLNTEIKPKFVSMPMKNYVMETLADTTKSEMRLGFKAKTSLDKGIEILAGQGKR